jgi:hypothetical protein
MSQLQQLRTTPPYDEPWRTATLINRLIAGNLNSVGTVRLTQNGNSTLLSDNNIGPGARLFFTPVTAHAALVSGLWYDPSTVPDGGGSVVLRHSAVDQADLELDYVILT